MYHARLMGIAHCIVPQLLPIPVEQQSQALLQQPPMELLASVLQQPQSHPILPNQMQMLQSPSIVQIIVPAHSIPPHALLTEKPSPPEDGTAAENDTLADESQPTTTAQPQAAEENVQTQEPLRSSTPAATTSTTTTPQYPEEDDIDEMILNEEDYTEENEEKKKQQRDRSDFKYVESFESEKSNIPARRFEPDPVLDNETELKNVIHENFSQLPSVLPVPKALSSPKDASSSSSTELDDEPPEMLLDQSSKSDDE
jgi:hypothetical protein